MIAAFLIFAAAAAPDASFGSPPFPPTTGGSSGLESMQPSKDALDREYESKAKALQAEMLVLRTTDGTELTAQHRAYLREKVDALINAYRRDLRRLDLMIANADGSPNR